MQIADQNYSGQSERECIAHAWNDQIVFIDPAVRIVYIHIAGVVEWATTTPAVDIDYLYMWQDIIIYIDSSMHMKTSSL